MKELAIGVLLDTDLDYGVGVLEGVREFARHQQAWRVLPISQAQEALLARLIRSGEIQALAGTFISDPWIESRFPASLPLVNTSNLSRITTVCSVVPDDEAVGRLMARHFCELKVPCAGVLADRATYASQLRRDGFLAELAARGVPVSEPSGPDAFRIETEWAAWLVTLTRETAVFCTSDALARRFHLLGKTLPLASVRFAPLLAGVGDSLTERLVAGLDLTSVPLPARAVGVRAAARLARLLENSREIIRESVPPEALVVRASTARYTAEDDVVARAMGLALQTLSQNLGVEEVARRVGVSRRTLETRFRKAFGQGPADVFRTQRLDLAKRLLTETGLRVAEIVSRTGSGSVTTFTTLFRRTFGIPPAEFRRRHRAGALPFRF